ncbi:MAG: hypothetical protein AUF79_04865 [Crenarchaeota archaeon 13_1_20CM_2_51_8]|nr:MAG: hypothetical protein AUF79_04865 [Crenarchaeota archaeon 13_1_20CM_2_51_8]
MSTPPANKKSRKGLLVLLVIVVAAVILVIPPALAGGLMVPVSKVVFGENTGSLSATQAAANVSLVTAYEYYFSIRAGGMFRTSDTSVSNSNGNTTITIDLKLTNPSGQTIDLGNTNISGGIGTRTHTIYLSIDQGVRASGSYVLNIDITANVTVGVNLQLNLTHVVTTTFTVS